MEINSQVYVGCVFERMMANLLAGKYVGSTEER